MKKLILSYLSHLIAVWPCAAQSDYEGALLLNNYDANQPIFYFDGTTIQLAPFQTLVQVLARAP